MEYIKSILPKRLLSFLRAYYHGCVAFVANLYFGKPSEKLVVIGVTGTAGKSTTIAILAQILNFSGPKAGYITTVNFFDGNNNFINKHGLSMPGGWLLQKQLSEIVKQGCKYAVVECTSEGLAQNRHWGINFDVALLTNLSMAHIESHGGFVNYSKSKQKLFKVLSRLPKKSFFNKKIIGVNFDDLYADDFFKYEAETKFGLSFNGKSEPGLKVYQAKNLNQKQYSKFVLEGQEFNVNLVGIFNAYNSALAASCAYVLGVDLEKSSEALKSFSGMPGRMEKIENNLGVNIIVDYGCEPASFKSALVATSELPYNKLIHVFGSTGGHRDVSKRFIFGKTSAEYADHIIITNDDVYDSDPEEIAKDIVGGIQQQINQSTSKGVSYEIILDRKVAIAKALQNAKKGDLVLITGKGSEQFLVLPGNKRIEWDDRLAVKQEINNI